MEELTLTQSQKIAFDKLCAFIDADGDRVFVLKGYAGTGKTTLMREFIKELGSRKTNYCLVASTGRAAKILSNGQ